MEEKYGKLIFIAIFGVVAGLFMIMKPYAVWEISQSWKNNGNTTASELYILSVRIGGIILLLSGIILFVTIVT